MRRDGYAQTFSKIRDLTHRKLTGNPQIPYEELSSLSEVIAAGTAAALVPIKSITMKTRGDKFEYIGSEDDEPGPVFAKLLRTLKEMQLGKLEDKFGWREQVNEPASREMEKLRESHAKSQDKAVDQLP